MVKNPSANAGDVDLVPGSGRFPWKRKWQPTPVFLPGKSLEQRILVGYSTWIAKESDMTEAAGPCIGTVLLKPTILLGEYTYIHHRNEEGNLKGLSE